jgi:hypothetical protein
VLRALTINAIRAGQRRRLNDLLVQPKQTVFSRRNTGYSVPPTSSSGAPPATTRARSAAEPLNHMRNISVAGYFADSRQPAPPLLTVGAPGCRNCHGACCSDQFTTALTSRADTPKKAAASAEESSIFGGLGERLTRFLRTFGVGSVVMTQLHQWTLSRRHHSSP